MSTNLSSSSVGGGGEDRSGSDAVYKSHEGEHHGDYSDRTMTITRSTYLFAFCAAVNSCNLGYDIGINTNVGPLIQRDLELSDVQRELFVGSLNLWSLFGSVFSNWICDRYGRRYSFVVAAISFIVGVVIMAIANGYFLLMVGRIFVGLGVGFGLAIDPLYISEISPASHRGELVTWSELAINLGIVFGFFTGLLFFNLEDGVQWRVIFICGAIMPIIMIILVKTVMPESPRWLVEKGLETQAKIVLQQIYPEGFNVEPVIQDIKEAILRERTAEQEIGWNVILFPTPAIKRMLIVGVGIAIAQQAVGIDAIQYYLIDILGESGIQSEKSRLAVLMMLGVLKMAFTALGGKLLDSQGRRRLFFISLAGMSVALLMISFTFYGKGEASTGFAVFGVTLYFAFFGLGVGPAAWLIPSEIFATSIRAKSMSVATFCNRVTATLMASTFLSTANAISWAGFFLVLAIVCMVVFAFIYFYLPETKGRSLEDMSLYFAEITGDQSLLEAEAKIVRERESGGRQMEMTPTASDPNEGGATQGTMA